MPDALLHGCWLGTRAPKEALTRSARSPKPPSLGPQPHAPLGPAREEGRRGGFVF